MAHEIRARVAWASASIVLLALVHGCESHPACVTSQDCDDGETCVYHANDGCSGTGKCLDNCDDTGGDAPALIACGCVARVVKLGCWGGDAVTAPTADANDLSCGPDSCASGASPDPSCPAATPYAYKCGPGHPPRAAGNCVTITSANVAFCCQNAMPCGMAEFGRPCPSSAPYEYACPAGVSPQSGAGACVVINPPTPVPDPNTTLFCCPD
jgi:hypothetical protein